MKKVLILAYDFPPYVSVGGLRPYSWYKYFKEYGIEPIVVTRQWSNKYASELDYIAASEKSNTEIEITEYGTIVKSSYKPNLSNKLLLRFGPKKFSFLRKTLTLYYIIFQWIWPIDKYNLYKAAEDFIKKNKVDVIIATGEPFVLFKYASLLSKKFNIPWVADYRDPWSQNAWRRMNLFFILLNEFFEKKSLKNAKLITTASLFVKFQVNKLIKDKKIEVIANGFDNTVLNRAIEQNNETLSIAFAGTIYKWHPIESFLKECCRFVEKTENARIQIDFYGIKNEDLRKLIDSKFQLLEEYINIYQKIPYNELLTELAKKNILLLFNDYSSIGTKIYDYIALKRKILFCYSNDENSIILRKKYYTIKIVDKENEFEQEKIINLTKSGIIVENSNELLGVIEDLYREYIFEGKIKCNSTNTEQFSRKQQTERLAQIIHLL